MLLRRAQWSLSSCVRTLHLSENSSDFETDPSLANRTSSSGWLLGRDLLLSIFPGAHQKSLPWVPFAKRMSWGGTHKSNIGRTKGARSHANACVCVCADLCSMATARFAVSMHRIIW